MLESLTRLLSEARREERTGPCVVQARAAPNISSERTAHSVRFWLYKGCFLWAAAQAGR
jgi:hypothetical protein